MGEFLTRWLVMSAAYVFGLTMVCVGVLLVAWGVVVAHAWHPIAGFAVLLVCLGTAMAAVTALAERM